MTCYHIDSDAIVVTVRLTPRSSRDGIDGVVRLADGTEVLQVRVRALPEGGAANAALTALLAKTFGVAKSAATVLAGGKSRVKRVRLEGDREALSRIAAQWRRAD